MYNYRMVKDGNSFSVMEVWYDDSGKPESFTPVRLSEPIHEDFLNGMCGGCATDKEKDDAARFQIIKELTMIINDLSNDAAPLINKRQQQDVRVGSSPEQMADYRRKLTQHQRGEQR